MFESLPDADGYRFALTVLYDFLERAARTDGAATASLAPESAPLRHLREYLAILDGIGDDPALREPIGRMVTDLMSLALGARGDTAQTASAGRAARLREIKADIANNIDRDDLSVTRIAARHRISPRYLQMLFAAEGTTFTRFVLDRRLDRAHHMLADPCLADRTITMIAFDVGFRDLSHFNHRFRRRFGVTPSQVRAETRCNGNQQRRSRHAVAGSAPEIRLQM
jgi:AraC-like DNA-binding protein